MVMNTSVFDRTATCCIPLGIDLSAGELAAYVNEKQLSEEQTTAIADLFLYLEEKKSQATLEMLLKFSRLPLKVPKTFENFDFSRIQGKDSECLKNLKMLSEIHARKNIAFIGPPGVGKTHLAQAYGRACCHAKMKVYFLKASELKAKFMQGKRDGTEDKVVGALLKPSCLIIDEIGRCNFDKECTRMFFDLIDRRYEKDCPNCMIFTSNRQPKDWQEFFNAKDDLNAALDRLFDDSKIINISGKSYRGRKREIYAVEANSNVSSSHGNKNY